MDPTEGFRVPQRQEPLGNTSEPDRDRLPRPGPSPAAARRCSGATRRTAGESAAGRRLRAEMGQKVTWREVCPVRPQAPQTSAERPAENARFSFCRQRFPTAATDAPRGGGTCPARRGECSDLPPHRHSHRPGDCKGRHRRG